MPYYRVRAAAEKPRIYLLLLMRILPSLKLIMSAPRGPMPNQNIPTKIMGMKSMQMHKNGINAMAIFGEGQQRLAT